MATDRSITIIGAGIAGLAAGCYARMNGYPTRILEMHDKPGGYCTGWKRGKYTLDGCIHHLAGAGPQSELYRIWQELGAIDAADMVFHDELVQVEGTGGEVLTVYSDIDRLERHLKEIAPGDAKVIEEYTNAARRFRHIDLLALPALPPGAAALKVLPNIGLFTKWGKITLEQFAARFSDPFLRQALPTVQYDFAGIPMLVHLNFLAGIHNRTLGWPRGGSLGFARAIEKRYRELGGEINYQARATAILVEGDKAVGVRLANGTEYRSDLVISAADGYTTIFNLLGGKYTDAKIKAYYDAVPDRCAMSLQIAFGVARDMTGEPSALNLFLAEPLTVIDKTVDRLNIEIFNFDQSLAPKGTAVVKVMFEAQYAYWNELREDQERYESQKRQIAGEVLTRLERRFPGLTDQVEVVDVATPVTNERYTGNWQGQQAWFPPSGGFGTMLKGSSGALPGLANFYMVGQWAGGMIGISTTAISGRKAVQMLCKQDKKRFRAQMATGRNRKE